MLKCEVVVFEHVEDILMRHHKKSLLAAAAPFRVLLRRGFHS